MKRRSIFGSHLYGQIVYPLLAAAILVGVIATVVAVYFLNDLTSKWVSQVAHSSSENVALRFEDYARAAGRETRLVAEDGEVGRAVRSGNTSSLAGILEGQKTALGLDCLMLLDADGKVLIYTDARYADYGASPLPVPSALQPEHSVATYATLKGNPVLAVMAPVTTTHRPMTIVGVTRIDDEFLSGLGIPSGSAFCIYAPDGRQIACAVGDAIVGMRAAQVRATLRAPLPRLRAMTRSTSIVDSSAASLKIDGVEHQVWVRRVNLPGPVGPTDGGYVVGLVSQDVSAEAGRTTRNLITMWSIVAVVALVGLGGWVARRVSDPLVELSQGARRIADGDFSTKVDVEGVNEIAELATTFNEMTDSLRERSETLTKKVLELATLYEMSRALGATLDMDELLSSVLESALRIFDLDLGYVTLRDKYTGELTIRSVMGAEDSDTDGAVRSSMSEWVVREGRPLIFNPDSGGSGEQVDSVTGARAALCVPLVSSEGTIGAITIGSTRQDYRFNSDDVRLLSTIANHVTIAVGNIELFTSLQEAYLATVRSLAAAVDAKDSYTRGHSDRVAQYATMIGEKMGLSHEQRIALEMAAYLHDIGKIGIPEEILLKPGHLDDEEMAQMRHHPLIGANILKPVAFPWAITPVVRHHHEAFDGSGYPAGLRGEEIPLLARILTVADSYEAMTSNRPYRAGRTAEEALTELSACTGSQFDARVVEVFSKIVVDLEETGTGVIAPEPDDVTPEEVRAIFSALVDGLFASFRRLGGPRLASNVEGEVDRFLETEGAPFRLVRGRLTFVVDDIPDPVVELELMQATLVRIDTSMGRVSGGTLVEHFYADAVEGLSLRMRHSATLLGFTPGE